MCQSFRDGGSIKTVCRELSTSCSPESANEINLLLIERQITAHMTGKQKTTALVERPINEGFSLMSE